MQFTFRGTRSRELMGGGRAGRGVGRVKDRGGSVGELGGGRGRGLVRGLREGVIE